MSQGLYVYTLFILITIVEIIIAIFHIIGINERNPVAPVDDKRPTNDSLNPQRIAGPNNGRRSRGEGVTHT